MGGNDNGEFTLVEGRRQRREMENSANITPSAVPEPKVSMAQKLRKTIQNIVVTGDSLARGVGHKLKEQVGDIVEVRAFGGAKLKRVTENIVGMARDSSRQLVVVAGANSIDEPTTDLLGNFEKIIDAGKVSSNQVVIVGLVKRYDSGKAYESKRILVNSKLKALCRDRHVKFIEYEPERSRLHRDRLHLNFRGQNELGQKVFACIKSFLV